MNLKPDITDTVLQMKAKGDQFAVATVVRTVSVTAAKPGAKAIIDSSGTILEGWVGGGCARHAVVQAACQAIADGQTRLVSIQPEELLKEQGLKAGTELEGKLAARNMCPSKGCMEIFIEPFLSNPELLIFGSSPVARTIVSLAGNFDFSVVVADINADADASANDEWADWVVNRYTTVYDIPDVSAQRFIVVATQGSGDQNALTHALSIESSHIGFVGSRRKTVYLKDRLIKAGIDSQSLAKIKGPAGLDIGSVTPQEIALSVLAELVQIRRART